MTAGAWPLRMRGPELHSRVRCRPFSTPQWTRARSSRASTTRGPRCNSARSAAGAPGADAFRVHPGQAVQVGPRLGGRHPFAETGAAQDRAEAPLRSCLSVGTGRGCLDREVSQLGNRGGMGWLESHQATLPYVGIAHANSENPPAARLSFEITMQSPCSRAATTRCKSLLRLGSRSGARPQLPSAFSWLTSCNATGRILPRLLIAVHQVRANREACLSHSERASSDNRTRWQTVRIASSIALTSLACPSEYPAARRMSASTTSSKEPR